MTGSESDGREPSDLASDLRVLAGLRSRTAVRDRHLSALFDLLPPATLRDREARFAALQHLVDDGLAAMVDPDHRIAATALLAFGPGRWRTIGQRGEEAAAVFGLGWDGYRRRTAAGSSRLDESLGELALAMEGLAAGRGAVTLATTTPAEGDQPETGLDRRRSTPDRVPGPDRPLMVPVRIGPAATEDAAERSPTPDRRPPRARHWVAGAAVLLLVLGTAWTVEAARSRPDRQQSDHVETAHIATCGNLLASVGDTLPGSDDSLARWSDPFRRAAGATPAATVRCAAPIEAEGRYVIQRISDGNDTGVGALVAAPARRPDMVVSLDALEWQRFTRDELEERDPAAALGAPLSRSDRSSDLRRVDFTHGVMIQESTDGPAYSVTQRSWSLWTRQGGLDGGAGRPLSQPYDVPGVGRVQDFSGGRIVASFRSGAIEWQATPTADRRLPDGYRGAVLTSRDATSWFVDLDGVRHWLPSTTDFECANGAHQAEPISNVGAAALASLPNGRPFRCR